MSIPTAESAPPQPEITDRWLPYVGQLSLRPLTAIRRVVIHCTELPDLADAREFGERVLYDSGTGNSGHFYIDRDGRIERWVPEDRIAHHVRDHNADSLGVELVNRGRWPHWYDSRRQVPVEPYPEVQIDALIALIGGLRRTLPSLATVAGHDQLDLGVVAASNDPGRHVRRKIDPGPLFPWQKLIQATGLEHLPRPS